MICTDNTEQVVQKINFSIFSIPKTFHDLKVVIKLKPRALYYNLEFLWCMQPIVLDAYMHFGVCNSSLNIKLTCTCKLCYTLWIQILISLLYSWIRFMWKLIRVLVWGATHLIQFLLPNQMGIMMQSLLPPHLTDSTNISDMRDMWSLGFQSNAISAWMGKNLLLALQMVLSTFMIISHPKLWRKSRPMTRHA